MNMRSTAALLLVMGFALAGQATGAGFAAPEVSEQLSRGVGPVVGMPCAPGYKLVGDDCVLVNIDFE